MKYRMTSLLAFGAIFLISAAGNPLPAQEKRVKVVKGYVRVLATVGKKIRVYPGVNIVQYIDKDYRRGGSIAFMLPGKKLRKVQRFYRGKKMARRFKFQSGGGCADAYASTYKGTTIYIYPRGKNIDVQIIP